MFSRGAAWTTRPGLRWFVRGAAVLVGLVGLVGVGVWFVGLPVRNAQLVPSVFAAAAAGLLTSEIVLRAFELPGRGFRHRYGVVASVCIGGSIEGAMLGWVFSLDGTLFPEAPPGAYAGEPLRLLGDLARLLLGAGLVGAVIGLVAGLAAGLVLGVPLAKLLGTPSEEG